MSQTTASPTRILIIDDHSIVRQGIRSLLSNHDDMLVVGEAASAAEALDHATAQQPDIALLDIRMPDGSGLDLARPLLRAAPAMRILILSSFDDDEYITQAMRVGVFGFITKGASDETLVSAIRAARRGERVLSPPVMNRVVEQFAELSKAQAQRDLGLGRDELELLRFIVDGASNADIAARLFVSEATIKRKLQDLYRKLGAGTRTQAVAEAIRRQIV
jgi:DNA-binding NarL/FixJ family response regulator